MSQPQLPLVMPSVPDQRWDCHSCTRCCRELVGDLRDEDRRKIDAQRWADRLGIAPYVSVGRKWALNKRDDGACVFLMDDGEIVRAYRHKSAADRPDYVSLSNVPEYVPSQPESALSMSAD